MEQKKSGIPWTSEEDWAEMRLSIAGTALAMGPEAASLQALSSRIVQKYKEIDMVLERVCLQSCPSCIEVCCTRATVWYDVRDLLVIYFATGILPTRQICRRDDHSCCNLTATGCSLERVARPFLCTWYICPAQKILLGEFSGGESKNMVSSVINEIKAARKELEEAYVKAARDSLL